ncbi:hypothetical protein [Acidipropionibacterium jensenii]|nr:hypothetical protein [Acidipropionibacterium jensenii]
MKTAPQLQATAQGATKKNSVPFANHDTPTQAQKELGDIPVDRLLDFLDMLNWSALRLLQDALTDGDVHYWQRRAQQFEDARRKPGEYVGKTTQAEREARDRDLAETALACRAKAQFVRLYGDPELLGSASIVIAGLMDDYRQEAAA